MKDLQKEFVPYELALRMKELGFDEPCFGYYSKGVLSIENIKNGKFFTDEDSIYFEIENSCLAPTWQSAFKWFREKKFQAEILWRGDMGDFCWKIGRFKYGSHFFSEGGFESYEEAELACLEKLIEIVENK